MRRKTLYLEQKRLHVQVRRRIAELDSSCQFQIQRLVRSSVTALMKHKIKNSYHVYEKISVILLLL